MRSRISRTDALRQAQRAWIADRNRRCGAEPENRILSRRPMPAALGHFAVVGAACAGNRSAAANGASLRPPPMRPAAARQPGDVRPAATGRRRASRSRRPCRPPSAGFCPPRPSRAVRPRRGPSRKLLAAPTKRLRSRPPRPSPWERLVATQPASVPADRDSSAW